MKGQDNMSECTLDFFSKNDVCSGNSAAIIENNDGRIFQKVNLKPNTNYKLSCSLMLKATNPLCISGYALLGAYTTDKEDIISGAYPTNRITIDSTLLIQLSDLEDFYQEFSFSFNSENHTKALIGIFHSPRAVKNVLFIDDFALSESGSNENILINPSFEEDGAWTYIGASKKNC